MNDWITNSQESIVNSDVVRYQRCIKHGWPMLAYVGLAHARPFSAPLRSTCLQAMFPPLWPRSAPGATCSVWHKHGPAWPSASCVCNPKSCKTNQISIVSIKYQHILKHGLSKEPAPYPTQFPLLFWGATASGCFMLFVCQLSFIAFLSRMCATCLLAWNTVPRTITCARHGKGNKQSLTAPA